MLSLNSQGSACMASLSPRQAASRLGVHYHTVYRWLQKYGPASWKPRGRWEIPEELIHRIFEKRTPEEILRFRVAADELSVASGDLYEMIRLGQLDPQCHPDGWWGIPASEIRRLRERRAIDNVRPVTAPRIPILGRVAAGSPMLAPEHIEGFHQLTEDCPGVRFAVRAEGHSMEPTIMDGDLLLVVPLRGRSPKQRCIVLAWVDGAQTCKRFVRENGRPVLRSDNPDRETYPDIPVDEDVQWIGQVVKRSLGYQDLS